MGALGVRLPDIAPHATAHVGQMIAMIARLIETGNAYEADGHVLFNVPSDPDYGALGRRDRDAMIAGARVEVASYKKDPADFVLWKPSGEDMIGWDSPWGRGRPGWHIECSAMIAEHLGETIDIHGGGLDLIFPHHENEIAQSRCAHGGAPLARYWVHNGFLSMAGSEKMSKSLGNVVTPAELLAEGHKGEVLRFALLTAHYRQPLEWSRSLIDQSQATLHGLYCRVKRYQTGEGDFEPDELPPPDQDVVDALCDDLNTPLALSRLSALRNDVEVASTAKFLGLLQEGSRWFRPDDVDACKIEDLIAARTEAKARRDFAAADQIRAELAEEGIVLEDGPKGTIWRRA